MKKAAAIVVLVFTIGLVMSSCNREVCPAMSEIPAETGVVPQA